MRFKEKLLLSGLLWAIAATSANAVVVLSQNFDDTAVFDASDITPRSVGDSSTQGGEWGVFDEGNVNPADFNGNGIGDAADYTAWRDGLGSTYTGADYDLWKSNFGQTAGSGGDLGPWVVNDGSDPNAVHVGPVHSGSQSIGFQTPVDYGGLQVFGAVDNGVPADKNYEVSFYLRQDHVWSSSMLTVGGDYVGADPQPIDLRVFFEGGTENIFLLYRNPGAVQGQGFWVYTGIQMIEDTWMKMRVVADVTGTGEYNIFVTREGEEEVAGSVPVPLHLDTREEIYQLDISRQGQAGYITYLDDFEMSYIDSPGSGGTSAASAPVPEPTSSALALLAVAGTCMRRRRRGTA